MVYDYCFIKKVIGVLFLFSLFCSIAQTESSLPKCQGTNFPTWTSCYGKVGPLPISGDIYVGEWKNGKYHGQGTIEYSDETKYIGQWNEGLPNGQGTLVDFSGAKYIGSLKDGKYNGEGTYTKPNGVKYVG